MKLNIFKIPSDQIQPLQSRLHDAGLKSVTTVDQAGWHGNFLFSEEPTPTEIPWVTMFAQYLGSGEYYNQSYFATFLFEKASTCYALSFGKAHFYIRPYCDYDFGIELAKRIAVQDDINQTAAKRFQGKQRKNIKSFSGRARLNIPPGESVDFLQAATIPSKSHTYGATGKFGTSALVTPDIAPDDLGEFLDELQSEFDKREQFSLPRTVVLTDDEEVNRFDEKLLDELMAPIGTSDLATNTYDLFGVDFVFGSVGSFTLKCGHYKPVGLDQLTMRDVKEYIAERQIPREKILRLRVIHRRDGEPDLPQSIKEAVDFISDEDRVVLSGGKWLKFNQDYLDYLNESVREIEIEETEPDFLEVAMREPAFNASLATAGYRVADKDFNIFKTRTSTPIEAWDASRGDTVYAIKFGTPQKLNHVIDQAMNVLELFHNKAEVRQIPHFSRYCLWLGYRAKKLPQNIADSGSIILKQKIDVWARRCEELGMTPVLKLSLSVKPELAARKTSSA